MALKLHPSYITDLQSIGANLSNLWLKSDVPMFYDSNSSLQIDNPCSMEVINLSDIRFQDRPTITVIDEDGNEIYVTQPILVDETYAVATNVNTGAYLPIAGGTLTGPLNIRTGGISLYHSGGGVTFSNGQWNNIGDDTRFGDINVANTFGVQSTSNNAVGYVRFGNTTSGTTIGTDGTNFTVSTPISGTAATFTGNVTSPRFVGKSDKVNASENSLAVGDYYIPFWGTPSVGDLFYSSATGVRVQPSTGNVKVIGTISEGGTLLSNKYAPLVHTQLASTITDFATAADARITAQKGIANGVATLGSDTKIPLSQLPASVIGQVSYQGTWNASTNTPAIPTASTSKGFYFVTLVAGTYNSVDYNVGDWIISDGTGWTKVDNTDAISSWNGRTGAITPLKSDYSAWFLDKAIADTYYLTSASSLAWNKLTGIPSTFTPSAHNHVWADITDKPSTFAPSAHNQAWSTITGTPTTLAGYGITDAATSGHNHDATYLKLSGGTMANDAAVIFNRTTGGNSLVLNGPSWNGIDVRSTGASVGAYITFVTPSNSSAYWGAQKRDAADFGTSVGCFAIEDNAAGQVNERFPLWIASGASGFANFNRRVSFRAWAANYSSITLNAPTTCWGGIILSGTGTDQTMTFAQVDATGLLVRNTNIAANNAYLDGKITTGDITVTTCGYIGYIRGNCGWTGVGNGEQFIFNGTTRVAGIFIASQNGLFAVGDYLGNSANDWVWFGYNGIHTNSSRYAGFMASKDGEVIASARYNKQGYLNAENSSNKTESVAAWNIDRFRVYKNLTVDGNVTGANLAITNWDAVYSKMDYFVQGSGNGVYGRRTTNISSFDSLQKSGFYDMNAAGPFGTTWQHLIRSSHTDPSNAQDKWSFDISAAFANGNGSEGYAVRVNTSAGWGTWRTIWTNLNLNQNCSTNQAPTFAGLTVSGEIRATDTVNGVLFGGNGRIWRDTALQINDPTSIYLRVAGNIRLGITATELYTSHKVSALEFHTSWGINGTYNFYGLAGGNTNQWATTGGFATNTTDTWIGGTNSFNVWIGASTNVITANSTNVTIGKPLYCSELHSTVSYAGTGLFAGTGDGASLSTYNQKLTSWYGTGIWDACNAKCTGYIDHRAGNLYMTGNIQALNGLIGSYATISSQLNVAGYMLLSKQNIYANTNMVIDITSPVVTILNQDSAINVGLPNSSSCCIKYLINVSGRTCTVSGSVPIFINGIAYDIGATYSFASNGKLMTCVNHGGIWSCSV